MKVLQGLAYLVAFCTKGSAVSGRSALRPAVREDLVVPGPRRDWDLRAFVVASLSCRNKLPVELMDLTVGLETFARHVKTPCSEHNAATAWFDGLNKGPDPTNFCESRMNPPNIV